MSKPTEKENNIETFDKANQNKSAKFTFLFALNYL